MTAHAHSRHHLHEPRSLGEQLADSVANGMGSWRFIIIQTVIVLLWMLLNVAAFIGHWDPYPFILLNLLFSTQAAYAAPVIMMSQNRQSAIDRKRDDHEATEVDQLFTINQQQITILNQQTEILNLLRQRAPSSVPEPTPTPAPPIPIKRAGRRSRAKKADTADAR